MFIDLGKQTSKKTGDIHVSLIRRVTTAREIKSCLKGMGLELGVLCSNSRCVTGLAISPPHLPGKGNDGAHLRRLWNESDDIGKKGEEGRSRKKRRSGGEARNGRGEERRQNDSPQSDGQLDSVPLSLTLFPQLANSGIRKDVSRRHVFFHSERKLP